MAFLDDLFALFAPRPAAPVLEDPAHPGHNVTARFAAGTTVFQCVHAQEPGTYILRRNTKTAHTTISSAVYEGSRERVFRSLAEIAAYYDDLKNGREFTSVDIPAFWSRTAAMAEIIPPKGPAYAFARPRMK